MGVLCSEKTKSLEIPIIDLSSKRTLVSELMVQACEEFGFFKVVNHGVSKETIAKMESEALSFFDLPPCEKHRAGPPNPLGYGCKNIGFNGDVGNIEYLLLHTHPLSISQRFKSICKKDPSKFCAVVNDYIEAARELACEILEVLAEGLKIQDKRVFSKFLKESDNDSVFRLNHYPASPCGDNQSSQLRVGFGEHSDPQILTLLHSNNTGGLQISLGDGGWISVPPDPNSFCVNVGDALQVLTNGRFISVRHRVLANSFKSRMSMMYFGAPPLNAWITPLPEMITWENPCLYRPFTWSEYKKATYSLRLDHSRIDLFKTSSREDEDDEKRL